MKEIEGKSHVMQLKDASNSQEGGATPVTLLDANGNPILTSGSKILQLLINFDLGTGDPVLTVVRNDTGATITAAHGGTGVYSIDADQPIFDGFSVSTYWLSASPLISSNNVPDAFNPTSLFLFIFDVQSGGALTDPSFTNALNVNITFNS